MRAAFLATAAVASLRYWRAQSLAGFVAVALIATSAYALLMRGRLGREPLAGYVARAAGRLPPRLAALLPRGSPA